MVDKAYITSVDDLVEGRLHVSIEHSCARYPVPDGFRLRPNADMLGCDGPCKPVHDLDYCCTPSHDTSVNGSWSPQSALISVGWQNGCIRGRGQLQARTEMNLTLNLERYKMKARLAFNAPGDSADLLLDGRSLRSGNSLQVVLDGSKMVFQDDGRGPATWEVCLLEHCSKYSCPHPYHQVPGEAFCATWPCSDPDALQACCSLNLHQNPNGPLWDRGFNSVFDATVPVSHWAIDALKRARDQNRHTNSTQLVCLAISEGHNFATTLCTSYLRYGVSQLGMRVHPTGTLTLGLNNISEARWLFDAIFPPANVIVVVGNIAGVAAALQALTVSENIASDGRSIVINALPFGSSMFENLGINGKPTHYVEPVPWPAPEHLFFNESAEEVTLSDFSKVYREKMSKYGHVILEDLLLSQALNVGIEAFVSSLSRDEAWLILETQSMNPSNFTNSTSKAQLFRNSTNPDLLQFLQHGASSRSAPSASRLEEAWTASQMIRFGVDGLRTDISRKDVGTRYFSEYPSFNNTYRFPAAASWEYMYARSTKSRPLMLVTNSTLRDWGLTLHPEIFENVYEVQDSEVAMGPMGYYPCPTGCQMDHYGCFACPPGTYRFRLNLFCIPCPANLHSDHYAASKCYECSENAICRSSTSSPAAKAGFYRIDAASEKQRVLQGRDACSVRDGGGLALIGADTTAKKRRQSLMTQKRWHFVLCDPPTVCKGDQLCLGNSTGFLCASCLPSNSRQHGFKDRGTCQQCPDTGNLVFQISLVVVYHAAFTYALARASWSSARSPGSLAAPLLLALVQKIQLVSFVVEISRSASSEGWNWFLLGGYMTKAMSMIMLDCKVPVHSAHDVLTHNLIQLAYIMAGYMVILLFFFCRLLAAHCRAAGFLVIKHRDSARIDAIDDAIRYATSWTVLMVPSGIYSCIVHCLYCQTFPGEEMGRSYSYPEISCDSEWQVVHDVGIFMLTVMILLQVLPIIMVWRNRFNLTEVHTRRRYCLMYAKLRDGWYMWSVMYALRIDLAIFTFLVEGVPHTMFVATCEVAYLLIFFNADPYMGDQSFALRKISYERSFQSAVTAAIGYSRQFGENPWVLHIVSIGTQLFFYVSIMQKLHYTTIFVPMALADAKNEELRTCEKWRLSFWKSIYGGRCMMFATTPSGASIATAHHTRHEQGVIRDAIHEAFGSHLKSSKLFRFADVSTGLSKALRTAVQSHRARLLAKSQKEHARVHSKKWRLCCRRARSTDPFEVTTQEDLDVCSRGLLADELQWQCNDPTLFHSKNELAVLEGTKVVSDGDHDQENDTDDADEDDKEATQATGTTEMRLERILPPQEEQRQQEPERRIDAPAADEVGPKKVAELLAQTTNLQEEMRLLKRKAKVFRDRAYFSKQFEDTNPEHLEKFSRFTERLTTVSGDINELTQQLAPGHHHGLTTSDLDTSEARNDNATSSLRKRPVRTSYDRKSIAGLNR